MTTAITIQQPETHLLEQKSNAIVQAAHGLRIDSDVTLQAVGVFLRQVKTSRAAIKHLFAVSIDTANKLHKTLLKTRNGLDAPYAQAEEHSGNLIVTYKAEEDRKRREEEDRLRQIAMKEEEDRRLAEAASLEADAAKFRSRGDKFMEQELQEAADATLDAPITTPAIILPSTALKIEGVSIRTTWKFRIDDVKAIPRKWLIPDEKAIGAHARSMGEKAEIQGISFYPHTAPATKVY